MNQGHAKLNSNCNHGRKVKEFQGKEKKGDGGVHRKSFITGSTSGITPIRSPCMRQFEATPSREKAKSITGSIRPSLFCRRRGGGGGGVGLGDGLELLEVEPDDGVREEAGVLLAVAVGDVDDVGLEDDGADLGGRGRGELGDGGDGAVVAKAMLAAGDGEAEGPARVVQEVEALGAGAGGEAGDDADLAEATRAEVVAGLGVRAERAAADEVLVHLGAVEAADDGPDRGWRRLDTLRDEGGALAWPHGVPVVRLHRGQQLRVLRGRQPKPRRYLRLGRRRRRHRLLLHRLDSTRGGRVGLGGMGWDACEREAWSRVRWRGALRE